MKLLKTKEYDIFKFREDNREKIDRAHVKKLINSIKSRNLLEMRPISVNGSMEVIDGQHRLLAAQELGVDIFYQIEDSLDKNDIILMNIARSWRMGDYLNYYTKNGYEEYLKLQGFMKEHKICLRVALCITMGTSQKEMAKFKDGTFVFNGDGTKQEFDDCWETIAYIKRMNGYAAYTDSSRFWKAILKLVKHALFDKKRWMENLAKMIERMGPRARTEDYTKLITEIYNWRTTLKIDLEEKGEL